jgi:membrane-associated protein
MESFFSFFQDLHTSEGLVHLMQSGGLVVLVAIVFAETGLLLGFFLPGDSLLITAGILSSPHAVGGGIFSPLELIVSLTLAAFAGDQLNYFLGRKSGQRIFNRPDGRFIKRKYFTEAHDFYEKYGRTAIIAARFMPIFRTFVPFVAGVAQMERRRYVIYNFLGGAFWVTSLITAGYFLGATSWAHKLHQIIVIVVIVSILPPIIGIFKRVVYKYKTG